jgi:hypothetical protein
MAPFPVKFDLVGAMLKINCLQSKRILENFLEWKRPGINGWALGRQAAIIASAIDVFRLNAPAF